MGPVKDEAENVKGYDCGCPSKRSLRLAKQRKEVLAYCDKSNEAPYSEWDDILNAHRTLCYQYTFVDYAGRPELDVCASLGFEVANDRSLPKNVLACAAKCNYLQRGVCPSKSRMTSSYIDEYMTSEYYSDDSNSFFEVDESSEEEDAPWRRNKHPVVLCKEVKCQNCLSPELLTFDDGEAQSCDLFVTEGKGSNAFYRGFHIKNAGIYNPWAHRCDTAAICCFQSDIDATISKPHVLINSQPLQATSISRSKPFGLISVFMTLSSMSYDKPARLIIKAYSGRKSVCEESVVLTTGCPLCFKPINTKGFSNINKVEFKFDLPEERLKNAYLDIDNLLVCM